MLHRINQHIQVLEYPGFHFPHCNCLLIEDDIRCLIDPSPLEEELECVRQRPVDLIINSHGHIDHYLYNQRFPESRILMHTADHAMAQSKQGYLDEFDIESFASDPAWPDLYIQSVQHYPTRIDGAIHDQQWIELGQTRLQVWHLPGHCAGHCGFFFPEQGFVFTTDIDFSKFGPWYANVHASLPDFLSSLERLKQLQPDYFIRGHESPFIREQVKKRLNDYRDIIFERQRRIVELLYSGRHTLLELAQPLPIYRRPVEPMAIFFIYEQVMIRQHLLYLEEQDYVIRDGDAWYLKKNLSPAQLLL